MLNGVSIRMEMRKERDSELEGESIELVQTEQQRQNKFAKKTTTTTTPKDLKH